MKVENSLFQFSRSKYFYLKKIWHFHRKVRELNNSEISLVTIFSDATDMTLKNYPYRSITFDLKIILALAPSLAKIDRWFRISLFEKRLWTISYGESFDSINRENLYKTWLFWKFFDNSNIDIMFTWNKLYFFRIHLTFRTLNELRKKIYPRFRTRILAGMLNFKLLAKSVIYYYPMLHYGHYV